MIIMIGIIHITEIGDTIITITTDIGTTIAIIRIVDIATTIGNSNLRVGHLCPTHLKKEL